MTAVETAADFAAKEKLIARYPEEFERLLREAGVKTVTVFRTTYKTVTEEEAEILCRHGWHKTYLGEDNENV